MPESMIETDRENIEEIIEVFRDQLEFLTDFAPLYERFFSTPFEIEDEALQWLQSKDEYVEVVRVFRQEVAESEDFDLKAVKDIISATAGEVPTSGRELYLPMRIAITGCEQGPEYHELMPVLGKKRCLKRIDAALAALN